MIHRVHDWRDRQPNPPPLVRGKRKHLLAGGKVVVRDPKTITGIVLHQTACVFGRAKGDPDRYERALGVACHALAFADGVGVIANPLRWYVQHGNALNTRSLGLEIEGRFPGLIGQPRTLAAKPETPVTELGIRTARETLRRLVELGRAEGMPLRYVWAHRQSSPTRRSDPGEAWWKALVLDFAVPELGLRTHPELVLENLEGVPGRPIPLEWDPKGTGRY